jgi:hypothetical protein
MNEVSSRFERARGFILIEWAALRSLTEKLADVKAAEYSLLVVDLRQLLGAVQAWHYSR